MVGNGVRSVVEAGGVLLREAGSDVDAKLSLWLERRFWGYWISRSNSSWISRCADNLVRNVCPKTLALSSAVSKVNFLGCGIRVGLGILGILRNSGEVGEAGRIDEAPCDDRQYMQSLKRECLL